VGGPVGYRVVGLEALASVVSTLGIRFVDSRAVRVAPHPHTLHIPTPLLRHILKQLEPGIGKGLRFGVGAGLCCGRCRDLGCAGDPGELAVVLALLAHRGLHLLGTPGLQLLHLLGDHGLVAQVQLQERALVLGTALGHRLSLPHALLGDALLHLGQGQGVLALARLNGQGQFALGAGQALLRLQQFTETG